MASLFLNVIPLAYNTKSFAAVTHFVFACNAKSFVIAILSYFLNLLPKRCRSTGKTYL